MFQKKLSGTFNSLSFLEKSRPLMEQYSRVHLMLDRDAAGRTQTAKALQWDREKYIDRSDFYQGRKDLNEWLIHREHSREVTRKIGRRL